MPTRSFPIPMSHGPPKRYATTGDLLGDALSHAHNRLLHACEAISLVGRLALKSKEKNAPTFTMAAAEVQDSTAGAGQQAAHLLAGQLLINGSTPWSLAENDQERVAWFARFMVTSAVPAPFNVADSAAEANGLKEAFRQGCERAWLAVKQGQRDLTPVYERFLVDADRAFQAAEQAKQVRSASARPGSHASDERAVEGVILRAYRANGVTAKEANRLFPLE